MGNRFLASLAAALAIVTLANAQTSTNPPSLVPAPAETNPPLSTLPDASVLPNTPALLPTDTGLAPSISTNAPSAKPKPKKPKPVNVISGKISSLDKTNMTVTVEGKKKSHTYAVTSASRFTKTGKPATFAEVAVGEQVRGIFAKTKAGGERIATLELNASVPKTAAATHKPAHKRANTTKKKGSKPLDSSALPDPTPSAPAAIVPEPVAPVTLPK